MANDDGIRRFSASELKRMTARGDSLTDHARLAAMTEADIERAASADPDFQDIPADWVKAAEPVRPTAQMLVSLRLDRDVIEGFRSKGPGYHALINAVLRAHLERGSPDGNGSPATP